MVPLYFAPSHNQSYSTSENSKLFNIPVLYRSRKDHSHCTLVFNIDCHRMWIDLELCTIAGCTSLFSREASLKLLTLWFGTKPKFLWMSGSFVYIISGNVHSRSWALMEGLWLGGNWSHTGRDWVVGLFGQGPFFPVLVQLAPLFLCPAILTRQMLELFNIGPPPVFLTLPSYFFSLGFLFHFLCSLLGLIFRLGIDNFFLYRVR